MYKVKKRMSTMKIELGKLIAQPIAIMWFHKSTSRSDTIKIHLKNLLVDVKNLL